LCKAERELQLELKTGKEIKEGLVAERVNVQAEKQAKTNNEHDKEMVDRSKR
jgi:hypothetical protein